MENAGIELPLSKCDVEGELDLKRILVVVVLTIFVSPIIISQFIRLPFGQWTIGDENSWVGFFGGYIGGIIGGLVAFLVARYQINEQSKKQIANEETIKFISQTPALMKIRYELENIHDSLKSILTNIDINKGLEDNDSILGYQQDMYVPFEQYWTAIDQLESVDLIADLLSIKFKYQQVSEAFMYDFFLQKSTSQRYSREVFESPGAEFEKLANVAKINKELNKVLKLKMDIISGEVIQTLISDVEDTLYFIRTSLEEIEEERERRHKIRVSVPLN